MSVTYANGVRFGPISTFRRCSDPFGLNSPLRRDVWGILTIFGRMCPYIFGLTVFKELSITFADGVRFWPISTFRKCSEHFGLNSLLLRDVIGILTIFRRTSTCIFTTLGLSAFEGLSVNLADGVRFRHMSTFRKCSDPFGLNSLLHRDVWGILTIFWRTCTCLFGLTAFEELTITFTDGVRYGP